MTDRSYLARMADVGSHGAWKHPVKRREKAGSIGPLFICLIGFLVAVFGIAIITG